MTSLIESATKTEHPLMSTDEVAKAIRVSVDTVEKLYRKDPSFPQPFRVSPRRKYWDRAEVEKWFQACRRGAADAQA
jgi:predicted DNA-binding transcriptional regulator AlpA